MYDETIKDVKNVEPGGICLACLNCTMKALIVKEQYGNTRIISSDQ
jgi:hypothetical protein